MTIYTRQDTGSVYTFWGREKKKITDFRVFSSTLRDLRGDFGNTAARGKGFSDESSASDTL